MQSYLRIRSKMIIERNGYKRARWQNLWSMEIDDFLNVAIQNITILIKQPKEKMLKSNAQVGQII